MKMQAEPHTHSVNVPLTTLYVCAGVCVGDCTHRQRSELGAVAVGDDP